MRCYSLLICVLFLVSFSTLAQRVEIVRGNAEALKGQTAVNVEFTYDNMGVGAERSEDAYVKRKKDDYNAKEPGRGDEWVKNWYSDRSSRFEPKFHELLKKYSGMQATNQVTAKYTIVFHTTFTEPGWNVGVMRSPARINAEALIVETENPDNVIALISLMNVPGSGAMGYDFDSGFRIQEAYAKAGKEVGKILKD